MLDNLTIKIMIVEDDSAFRNALKIIVGEHPQMTCIAAFKDGETALANLPKTLPDLVLMDLQLPGISGIECIAALKKVHPFLQCMILTRYGEDDLVFDALSAGANGYVLKDAGFSKILNSILELHSGGAPMSAQIARKVVSYFQTPIPKKQNPYEKLLSNRQKEVIELLSKGYLYKEIAALLYISPETVKSHCHAIYKKLHADNKTEAIRKYYLE